MNKTRKTMQDRVEEIKFRRYVKNNAKKARSMINEIYEEANDRLWVEACRNYNGNLLLKKEYENDLKAEMKQIIDKYNIDEKKVDDLYIGHWEGILTVINFLMGGGEADINYIRDYMEMMSILQLKK